MKGVAAQELRQQRWFDTKAASTDGKEPAAQPESAKTRKRREKRKKDKEAKALLEAELQQLRSEKAAAAPQGAEVYFNHCPQQEGQCGR